MRGKTRYAVQLIGCDMVLFERVRASLGRSPFHFIPVEESASGTRRNEPQAAHADLLVAPAELSLRIAGAPEAHPPIIAFGPPGLLRPAFLAGCADYLKDPWTPDELSLRALNVLARLRGRFVFPWGEISFEGTNLVTPGGLVGLTHHESRLLGALLQNRGAPVSREALGYVLWGKPGSKRSRAIDAHLSAVRRKVSAVLPGKGRRFIISVRSQGYMVP